MNKVVKNQIKLYYNPFSKVIVVERLDDQGVWIKWKTDLNESWDTPENAVLQNVAPGLLKEINENYNTGNSGMHIEFFGTSSDFVDLKDILDKLKNGVFKEKSIELTHNQEDKLPSGEEAKEIVDSHYKKIEEIISSSSMDSVKATIAKYREVSKPTIKVCVIGNYSTGKSTFLNAIIGKDILLSDTDPTTAKNVSIRHCEEMCISFKYDEIPISILWDKKTNKYKYSEAGPVEFKKKLDKSAEKETDAFRQVHAILKMLNQILDEKLSTDIELRLPFTNNFFNTSEVEYVFVDTPGSNAAEKRSEKHKEILAHALEDKTSALPVILVDRNSLFSKDNKDISDALQEDGVELDVLNKLFLINMADRINVPTLRKDLNNNALKEVLKENDVDCVLYFSALIALGAQTELHDESCQSDYKTYKARFSNDKDDEFRNLEEYAILPTLMSRLSDPTEVSGETDNYLKNSGMLLFQRILDNFAKKYSYYTKAESCRKLLLEAIDNVEKEQTKAFAKLKKEEIRDKEARDAKRKELICEIEKDPDLAAAYTKIANEAHSKLNKSLSPFLASLLPEVTRQWNAIKGKKAKDEEKTAECHRQMVSICNEEYKRTFNEIKCFYEGEFDELVREYKLKISSIIRSDEELSDESKDRLTSIKDTSPTFLPTYEEYKSNKNAFSKVFLFWGEKINPKKYTNELKEDFLTKVSLVCADNQGNDFKRTFKEWVLEIQRTYTSNIDSKSITLKEYDSKISECKGKISDIAEILEALAESKDELESMASFKREALQ